MTRLAARLIAAFALLALLSPARAQEAVLPGNIYPYLVDCYVYFEQDKSAAQVRGDNARMARRQAGINVVMQLIPPAGRAAGKTKEQIDADLRDGMTSYFNRLASGEITPEELPGKVQACETWIAGDVSAPPKP